MTAAGQREGHAPVAVVGIGCRFPGGISDAGGFWRFLSEGKDAIGEIPASRIDIDHFFDPRPATAGRMMTRWGGFLDGIDSFDADFFGISPREAERLDPQQRLLLEIAWEALEDGGQDLAVLADRRCGVFVGQWLNDFEARLFEDPEAVDFFMTTGSGRYASSGRISYALGLQGPSMTVDTACSSSLVAVHLAVQSLRSGESGLALAGGVNIILQPHISVAYSQSRMMAPDGRCKFGDISGDGYVRSEGAALVVLKRLSDAQADGDRVYAVIRGSAVNNDGRSSGSMGTPSAAGQAALLRAAYADAGVPPAQVGLIEAHGTGTRAGDPVEFGALNAVLKEGRQPSQRCLVGSVKTNLGHTEGAAGIAGMIKATLALHHRVVPPSLHLREPNPAVAWDEVPLQVPRRLETWEGSAGSRTAGVSAFGIAGTNAHVVLTDAPAIEGGSSRCPDLEPASAEGESRVESRGESRVESRMHAPAVLPLSARSAVALGMLADRYANLLEADKDLPLDRLCWTAATRRTALPERAVFVAPDSPALVRSLREFAAGGPAAARGSALSHSKAKVAFVLPGQGGQWVGMGRELAARETVFKAALAKCDQAARPYLGCSILEQIEMDPASADYRLDRITLIQPVLVAMAIAYAALWRSWGVLPDAVVGHSMGEVAAAHLAGVIDLDQAMRIICRRSSLMQRTSGRGAMALVELSRAEAEARLAGYEASLSVAVTNSPRSTVVSGDTEAVSRLLKELEQDQVFCRLIKVDVASHSPQMEPLAIELVAELTAVRAPDALQEKSEEDSASSTAALPPAKPISIYSTVLGREALPEEFDATYWGRNLRQPVQFAAAVDRMIADGFNVFVELGPHPVLVPSVEQCAQPAGAGIVALACGRHDEPEQATILAACGGLWCSGYPVELKRLTPPAPPLFGLPFYPWQRERHWLRAAELRSQEARRSKQVEPLSEAERQWLHRLAWVAADSEPASAPATTARGKWLLVAEPDHDVTALVTAFGLLGWEAEPVRMDALAAAVAEGAQQGIVLLPPGSSGTSPDAPFAPVRLLQSVRSGLAKSAGARAGLSPRLWLATRGGQRVVAEPAGVDVLQAAMWGAGRVIAEEHPELWGGMVDLDPVNESEHSALQFAREVTGATPGAQVAFRQGARFVLRLQAAEEVAEDAGPLPWRADAAYLITGGLGGIGLHVADSLVELGARRLVLLGRSSLPPRSAWGDIDGGSRAGRQVAAIRALESKGASVHLMQADVSDEESVRRALQQYESEAWPKIRGVIHAAGLVENRLAHEMDAAAFERVFAAKARGALILDRLLPDLQVFIMFSSVSGFLGVPGMANYGAANVALDLLAADRRAGGKHALSIQWGPWRDTGLHAGPMASQKSEELGRQGISELAPDQALRIFTALQGTDEPAVAVMPVDFAALRRARSGRDLALFEGRGPALPHSGFEEGGLAGALAKAPSAADRRLILMPLVREVVGGVLKLAPARLDSRRALGTMGLTSLMAMELRNRLEAQVGRPLSATLAWNYPTVDSLVSFLAEITSAKPAEKAVEPNPGCEAGEASPGLEAVVDLVLDAMTEEAAAELLRHKRPVPIR